MNLAFQSIVLIFLLVPGVLLVFSYKSNVSDGNISAAWTESPSVNSDEGITSNVITALVLAPMLHLLWCVLYFVFFQYFGKSEFDIDFKQVSNILTGSGEALTESVVLVFHHPFRVMAYFISLYLFSIIAGVGLRKWVLKSGLYLKHKFLMKKPEWFNIFSGYEIYNQFPSTTVVSVTVELGGKTYIYMGSLYSYTTHKRELVRIILNSASRRKIEKDASDEVLDDPEKLESDIASRYYPVRGELLVIEFDTIKTVNVDYVYIDEVSEEQLKEILRLENQGGENVKSSLKKLLRHKNHIERSFDALKKVVGGYSDDEIKQLLHEINAKKIIREDGSEWWYLAEREQERVEKQKSRG